MSYNMTNALPPATPRAERRKSNVPVWTYNRYTGAKGLAPELKVRIERRILTHAEKHYAGKFAKIDVRFRGALCYIDVYTEPGETIPTHLCRIHYLGTEDRWRFAFYSYAHDKYEPSFLMTGSPYGTPEEAFETSALFF